MTILRAVSAAALTVNLALPIMPQATQWLAGWNNVAIVAQTQPVTEQSFVTPVAGTTDTISSAIKRSAAPVGMGWG
jgi:hypothetical protein